jgi:ParB family chromosome partitioning protein
VLPRQKVKDTRAALVEHFNNGHFVHPTALFAPDKDKLSGWLTKNAAVEDDELEDLDPVREDVQTDETPDDEADEFREAAE